MKSFLVILLAIFHFGGLSQMGTSYHFIRYEKNNYAISYPNTWQLDTSRELGTVFEIISRQESKSDKYREMVNFVIQDLTGRNIDLQKYAKITEEQIKGLGFKGHLQESIIVRKQTQMYYKVSYEIQQGDVAAEVLSYCYIKDQKAYLVTFSSEFSRRKEFKAMGDRILDSFALAK